MPRIHSGLSGPLVYILTSRPPLPFPPTLDSPNQGGEGAPQLRTAENLGEGWAEESHSPSPCQLPPLPAVPLITPLQSSWGSQAPSVTRSLRDNGIFSGGRGRLRPGLRRRHLLPSICPSAPNVRLRRLGTGGRADAGGSRVAGPGRPNSISWTASASEKLWARRGSGSGQLLFVSRVHAYGFCPSPFGTPSPYFWHLGLPPPPIPPPPRPPPGPENRSLPPRKSWETVVLVGPVWPSECETERGKECF